jgi:hypothetical protein
VQASPPTRARALLLLCIHTHTYIHTPCLSVCGCTCVHVHHLFPGAPPGWQQGRRKAHANLSQAHGIWQWKSAVVAIPSASTARGSSRVCCLHGRVCCLHGRDCCQLPGAKGHGDGSNGADLGLRFKVHSSRALEHRGSSGPLLAAAVPLPAGALPPLIPRLTLSPTPFTPSLTCESLLLDSRANSFAANKLPSPRAGGWSR